jgi:beta-galactosidase
MKPYAGFLADKEEWEAAFLERMKRMYGRDKNHPCIIAWSLGNESGYGAHHDVMMAWLERADPSRCVMYEPGECASVIGDCQPGVIAA